MSSIFDKHPVPFPPRQLRGFVDRVIDGDTYWITVDCGFHASMTIAVRLRGVNAAELTTEAGKLARAAVQRMIEGKPVLVTTYRDKQSFARWVADVQFYTPPPDYGIDSEGPGTWADFADWLVGAGFAVRV